MNKITAVLLILAPGLVLGADAHPAATAEQWLLDTPRAAQAVMNQAESLAQMNVSAGLLAWVLGGLGAAVAILRLTPAWGPLLGLAWDALAPKSLKLSEQQQAAQAQGFRVIVKTIEKLPQGTTLANLRDKLARKMPDPVKDAVESYLDGVSPTIAPAAPTPAPAPAPAESRS